MLYCKKIISLVLCLLMLCSFAFAANAVTQTLQELSVVLTVGTSSQTIRWTSIADEYFLFLPGDVSLEDAVLQVEASATVEADDKVIADGSSLSVLPVGQKTTLTCGGVSYDLTVLQSSAIPSLHIATESGSMEAVHASKDHKEPAQLTIFADDKVVLEKELEYIKGRGNSTWSLAKKPYNIKFDKKTDLFGMGKAKKWSLLANHVDRSLLRNHIALSLAQDVGIPYTSSHVYVDLYVNNEYYGNYCLTESVEIGETRVDIADLAGDTEDVNEGVELDELPWGGDHTADYTKQKPGTQKWVEIPNDPDDITGGYLLEFEMPSRYPFEISGFVTDRGQPIVIKEPECASEAQAKYIAALYQEFEDAVFSATGFNDKGKHYSEYIDMESFVRMYLFQEYVKNLDAGFTSFYICKDRNSDVFVAAPVWDFDHSLGKSYNAYGMNLATASGWWASVLYQSNEESINLYQSTILNALFRQDGFFESAKKMWQTEYSPLLTKEYTDNIYAFAETMADAVAMNCVYWNTYSTTDFAKCRTRALNYMSSTVIKFMKDRKAFMDDALTDDGVRVFFDPNGGTGAQFNTTALHLGENYTLPASKFTNEGMFFKEWNTKPDGTGKAYKEGSKMLLRSIGTTLYAQWTDQDPNELNDYNKPILKDMFATILELFRKVAAYLPYIHQF
ncbi:MAG: CotH kinase family protein [Clostridia bacterium]|nr:CotH kinase family protein [Clostridia bacterium]